MGNAVICTGRVKVPESKDAEEQEQVAEVDPSTLPGEPVYLNVYNLMSLNAATKIVGLGVYHTGVECYGREYSYAGHFHLESTGLKDSEPGDTSWLNDATFSERIYVGQTELSQEQVADVFEKLKPEFLGPSYNVLDRNCNHFTSEMLLRLTGKDIPPYVNRLMKVARRVRVCLPGMFKYDLRDQDAPAEYDSHKLHVPQPRDYERNRRLERHIIRDPTDPAQDQNNAMNGNDGSSGVDPSTMDPLGVKVMDDATENGSSSSSSSSSSSASASVNGASDSK